MRGEKDAKWHGIRTETTRIFPKWIKVEYFKHKEERERKNIMNYLWPKVEVNLLALPFYPVEKNKKLELFNEIEK